MQLNLSTNHKDLTDWHLKCIWSLFFISEVLCCPFWRPPLHGALGSCLVRLMGAPALVISVMHCVATLKQTLKYHETHLLNAPYDQPRAGVSTAAVRGHVRVFECILMRRHCGRERTRLRTMWKLLFLDMFQLWNMWQMLIVWVDLLSCEWIC